MTTSVLRRLLRFGFFAMLSGMVTPESTAAEIPPPPFATHVDIDLGKPFNTRSHWRFIAMQDPAVFEPIDPALVGMIPKDFSGSWTPGVIHLCLKPGPAAPCAPDLVAMSQPPAPIPYSAWEPHYLNNAELVYLQGQTTHPLLLLQTASTHSTDGNQAVFTQLLAYIRSQDHFKQVYSFSTGQNNNEDVRFIASGPLQGSVISVEPTNNSPFVYWVTVNRLTASFAYKSVLRYRSATHYNDGNSLAVIDSEMANIERRLGLWRLGSPIPVPTSVARSCEKPRLYHMELWCH